MGVISYEGSNEINECIMSVYGESFYNLKSYADNIKIL